MLEFDVSRWLTVGYRSEAMGWWCPLRVSVYGCRGCGVAVLDLGMVAFAVWY